MDCTAQFGKIATIIIKDTRESPCDVDIAISIPLIARAGQMQYTQWAWVMKVCIERTRIRIQESPKIR
jgi:hypothetical protein